jgi:hypothetical protein
MARLLLPIAVLLCTWAAQAQTILPSVVNSSGGEIQNATVFVEWSLGEPAIATISNAQHIVTQGFLQPNLVITGVDDPLFQEEITVYPNPFSSHLFFQTTSTRIESLLVRDMLGRQVLETAFSGEVDLRQLPSGVYFISLLDGKSRVLSTFKVVKI